MSLIFAGFVALTILALTPGPDMAVATKVTLSQGVRAGVIASLGICTGVLAWGAVTVAGLAALIHTWETGFTIVRWLGAAYLVWLGINSLRTPKHIDSSQSAGVGRSAYKAGLISNLLNPKIAIFYSSLLPQFVPAGYSPAVVMSGLILGHWFVSVVWLIIYVNGIGKISAWMNRPRISRAMSAATGSILIGFGVRVALTPT